MNKIKNKTIKINNDTMIVAVDIGPGANTVIFRSIAEGDSPTQEFSNTRVGFDRFRLLIRYFKIKFQAKKVIVGFESTGVYADPLLHYLLAKGIKVVMVNPVHSKRVKEIRDNSPNKTDKKDPTVIADLIQLGCVLSVLVAKGHSADLRHLMHTRERSIGNMNRSLNQLFDLVWKIFPEFTHVFKSLKGKTALYILTNYTLPEQVAALKIDELILTMRKKSRGRYSIEQIKEFHELTSSSVGIVEGKQSIVREIKHLIDNIERQENFITEIEKEISEIVHKIPSSRYILSIKGIGIITVAGILGETANFSNMSCSAQVEKLAGLNLFEISSGKHKGQKRISKRGRSLLRKILYFAALNVIRCNPFFKEKYQSYLKTGKLKNKALIAIARKLLRVIFALVHNKMMFDENYAKKEINKAA
jgi:transposase